MSDFDKLLRTTSPENQDALIRQALKKREYNRNYQRRLRTVAKLVTLQRKVDENLSFVIGYIKTNHADAYKNWKEPRSEAPPIPEAFGDWLAMSQGDYQSAKAAYDIAGIKDRISFGEFGPLFEANFSLVKSGKKAGRWVKITE